MKSEFFDQLLSYYLSDPAAFVEVYNGSSDTSSLYHVMAENILVQVKIELNSVYSKVVRLDMDGNLIYSDNTATFGKTKSEVKNICSRINYNNVSQVFIADASGKRAYIIQLENKNETVVDVINTLFSDQIDDESKDFALVVFGNATIDYSISKTLWEYKSNKYICGFTLVPVITQTISIRDDAIVDTNVTIRQGTTVSWENNSSIPISIYSGKTTLDIFNLDPELSIYGNDFSSGVLQPGDTYTHKFFAVREYDYFIYPGILTGQIDVTDDRVFSSDQFIIIENDGLNTPFSSRIVRVDNYGNVLWSYGEAYIVNPRNVQALLNNDILVST